MSEFDPLRKAKEESTDFTAAWVGNGASPTRVQRIGFGLLSVVSIGATAMFGRGFVDLLQARELNAIYFFGVTMLFVFLSVLAVRNVFRK
jgi:hypothetical protein